MQRPGPESAGELLEAARRAGLRLTRARCAVLQALVDALQPVTHRELARTLRNTGVNQATVYRNLRQLEDVGLVKRIALGDRLWRYELLDSGDATPPLQAYFHCLTCGTLLPLPANALQPPESPSLARIHEIREVVYRGICRDCKQ